MSKLNSSSDLSEEKVPQEILQEAQELASGGEILPGGAESLARKIYQARLAKRPLRVKLGVDPTNADLHLGHAVTFRKLRKFQEFGHQVVLIIGGFTAQIGDPTGRNTTRPPLTLDEVNAYAQTYLDQMGLILDVEKTEVVNNNDWLASLSLKDVIKLAGTVTANQLLAKESFGNRIDQQLPVGFHEMFYPLLQGYDSVAIKSDIELGGTDQRFNILQGRELQPFYGVEQQLALLMPLLEGIDGVQKMSKSFGNYIALKDSPNDMFAKCMRIPDELILRYFELATDLNLSQLNAINKRISSGDNPKNLKEELGCRIVELYHRQEESKKALEYWQKVHSKREIPEDIPVMFLEEELTLPKVLTTIGYASSGSEAKRLVQEGAVRIDDQAIKDIAYVVKLSTSEFTLQVGRRKFARIRKK